eukprot:2977046-Amphidinium_carterae.2
MAFIPIIAGAWKLGVISTLWLRRARSPTIRASANMCSKGSLGRVVPSPNLNGENCHSNDALTSCHKCRSSYIWLDVPPVDHGVQSTCNRVESFQMRSSVLPLMSE